MKESVIKKIIKVSDLEKLSEDIKNLHEKNGEKFHHNLGLIHDKELITKSLSHESLLIWNIHIWGHFNGEKFDGVIATIIRKNEKFNKKMMDEYMWYAENSNCGMKLYKTAINFAKEQNCAFVNFNLIENSIHSEKLRNFYLKMGFIKDTESYIKLLN
jgi:hypothetical protein